MFYHGEMNDQWAATANHWLSEHTTLGWSQRKAMSATCSALLDRLPACSAQSTPPLISIAGAPGSGKSTLAHLLGALLKANGRQCQVVSLDDYYLPQAERQALARQIHPLCAMRGVPGSHDLPLLLEHLEKLKRGDIDGLALPVFDKASDDRRRQFKPCECEGPPDYILLEGWVCGARPQSAAQLAQPCNVLEAQQDAQGIWRKWVNGKLRLQYDSLDRRVDHYWYLQVPDWSSVVDWRWQQEQELPIPALTSRQMVEEFLAPFQRLVQAMLDHCADWAELVIALDTAHCATIPQQIEKT